MGRQIEGQIEREKRMSERNKERLKKRWIGGQTEVALRKKKREFK